MKDCQNTCTLHESGVAVLNGACSALYGVSLPAASNSTCVQRSDRGSFTSDDIVCIAHGRVSVWQGSAEAMAVPNLDRGTLKARGFVAPCR
eukprot:7381738-Prymnesium_polylepis.1